MVSDGSLPNPDGTPFTPLGELLPEKLQGYWNQLNATKSSFATAPTTADSGLMGPIIRGRSGGSITLARRDDEVIPTTGEFFYMVRDE